MKNALLLPSIILNANRRTKNRGGLGTRLSMLYITSIRYCHSLIGIVYCVVGIVHLLRCIGYTWVLGIVHIVYYVLDITCRAITVVACFPKCVDILRL